MIVTGALFLAGELLARQAVPSDEQLASASVPALMAAMPGMRISGREVGQRMIVHNVALLSRYPSPEAITRGYVGTSRSKYVRPRHFGIDGAVVGAGNSYNEISYGLLAQAEALRLQFPNLKTMYVETSFLLRRPAAFVAADDHRKYLPIIASFEPLCARVRHSAGCRTVFAGMRSEAGSTSAFTLRHSRLLESRASIRLSRLLVGEAKAEETGIPVLEDSWFPELAADGEQRDFGGRGKAPEELPPRVGNDDVKVQRMRDITGASPWDGLFDLFGEWGKAHGIQVVFFQPPVRSDLYDFQARSGLEFHVADLRRVSRAYGIPFIDLDRPELGYSGDWALFSDTDHMNTCLGSGLLTLAVERGYLEFKETGNLSPTVPRSEVEAQQAGRLEVCSRQ